MGQARQSMVAGFKC